MGSCPSASGLSHSAWDGPEVPPGRSRCQNVLLWRPNDTHWMSGPRFSCLLIRHTCTAPPLAAVNNAVRNSSAQVFKPQLPTFGPVPGSRTAGSHGDSTLCLLSHLQAASHGSRPASHPTGRVPAPHFSTFWPTLVSWVLTTILPVGVRCCLTTAPRTAVVTLVCLRLLWLLGGQTQGPLGRRRQRQNPRNRQQRGRSGEWWHGETRLDSRESAGRINELIGTLRVHERGKSGTVSRILAERCWGGPVTHWVRNDSWLGAG